jgi:PAS domain S-box-containing protein
MQAKAATDRTAHGAAGRPPAAHNRAAAVRLERRCRRLQQRNAYLAALHETSLQLIERLDRKELLQVILERAALLTGTRHGYIYLLEPGQAEMQLRVGKGIFSRLLGLRVTTGQGVGGVVWQSGRPVMVPDYGKWAGRLHDPSLDRLKAVVGIPLRSRGQVLGVIGLATVDHGKPFAREDLWVLRRFADLALIALDKAGLYEELKRELAERQRTAVTLRESEERYRQLLEASPDPVVVYDMRGNATYVNPAFEQTFGWTRHELLGKSIDFVPRENWPETRRAIDDMLSGRKILLFETRRSTKDGRVLDVQLSSTLYRELGSRMAGNIVILRDISAQKHAEREVRRYHEQLEELVAERTVELAHSNRQLEQEIEERRRAEGTLMRREVELESQRQHLEEVNTALKVLLKQREADRKELGENVLSNVKELVAPYLDRLKRGRLDTGQEILVRILESNLGNILSPFISQLSSRYFGFTPTEIRLANLIKDGRTNKEIADLMCLSKNTVLFHRQNIRRKLGLKRQKVNLRSHLLAFDE